MALDRCRSIERAVGRPMIPPLRVSAPVGLPVSADDLPRAETLLMIQPLFELKRSTIISGSPR
jgi:hypothetical protein